MIVQSFVVPAILIPARPFLDVEGHAVEDAPFYCSEDYLDGHSFPWCFELRGVRKVGCADVAARSEKARAA